MTAEQEAIEAMARAMSAWEYESATGRGIVLADAANALAALTEPRPCPTCGGEFLRQGQSGDWINCPDCTDGTLPPLLRWNEDSQ
jgi:hypothetical protein